MDDSATLVTVRSRTIISMPVHSTISAAQRRRSVVMGALLGNGGVTSASNGTAGIRQLGRRSEHRAELVEDLGGALLALGVGVETVEEGALLGHHQPRAAGHAGDL